MVPVFKSIFLNENFYILMKISQRSIPEGLIDNKSALVQIMAWRRTGDKALSEPMLAYVTDACMRHFASSS